MGRRKKSEVGDLPALGVLVRQEVMNTIYRNVGVSVQLPSSQDLARKFNISRCTVMREMRELTEEGYILGKRGVGTFTNPDALPAARYAPGRRIVGLLNRDGRLLFDDYDGWALVSHVGMELPPEIGHPRRLSLSGGRPELVLRELRTQPLDGLVWAYAPEEFAGLLRELREGGMAVATLMRRFPGVPAIDIDKAALGTELGRLLLERGKTRCLWHIPDPMNREVFEAVKAFFRSRGVDDDIPHALDHHDFMARLTEMLERRQPPDALYVHSELVSHVLGLFERHGLSPFDDCLLVAEKYAVRRIAGFRGIVRDYPFQAMGRLAAEWMRELLGNPAALAGETALFPATLEVLK